MQRMRIAPTISGNLSIWGSLTLGDALMRAGEVDVLRTFLHPQLFLKVQINPVNNMRDTINRFAGQVRG